jgi:hypothetical protein
VCEGRAVSWVFGPKREWRGGCDFLTKIYTTCTLHLVLWASSSVKKWLGRSPSTHEPCKYLPERNRLGIICLSGTILQWTNFRLNIVTIFKYGVWGGGGWTGFSWLWIWVFGPRSCIFGFRKRQSISSPAEWLSASQRLLCCIELVTCRCVLVNSRMFLSQVCFSHSQMSLSRV